MPKNDALEPSRIDTDDLTVGPEPADAAVLRPGAPPRPESSPSKLLARLVAPSDRPRPGPMNARDHRSGRPHAHVDARRRRSPSSRFRG